jgi:hypothetical protein
MKLAIFADSWGDDYSQWPRPYSGVGLSWLDYIRANSNYEITNYSMGASSLWFQYDRFIKNYANFDKIIFFVTEPGRVHCLIRNELEHWVSYEQVQRAANNFKLDYRESKKIDALKNYYSYIKNDYADNSIHDALLSNIKWLRPDVKFVSGFPTSRLPDSGTNNLLFLAFIEPDYFKVEVFGADIQYYDARKCHMSEENHLIFGKKILDYLDKDCELILDRKDFVHTSTKPFEHYFREHFAKLK